MLEYIISETNKFLEQMPKSKRKKKGQFFTSKETAEFMATMFQLEELPLEINILDPGTGTGILSAAIVEHLLEADEKHSIHLTCYETDEDVLPVLKNNMAYILSKAGNRFSYEIREQDYILSQQNDFLSLL